ncbi:cellulose biosynthesis cyclic di-GMP-binding regulatory protein BcsB [Caballeronia sp. LZ062]|uniref:cellulose biosynthesis cyclic di-GMP-binding regulatory protein BcsB n=1 Tax=unclassified Caballeronia TaxID=2646786 RepID=UPI00285C8F86|nr:MULTISPECIES: cellulose biosynthesis cyclic di-GMP-binding regulatory protein BcsB [unclassified Caballeronia]MDR5856207.1 cellulose biosynthesis cyclic di-GMP-binding regulatory protein BcsB [Caballeronia sp. LZ050]MDR5872878.1 cellulose biosynthesis cyclic di-GMP-binding regulatory protein BcsB [Caballeronia sp. LZ062]
MADSPGDGKVHIPFSALGAYRTLSLRGLEDIRTVNVGVRRDRLVKAARLHLVYSYSPALLFSMSHLKVSVNDQVVATLRFTAEAAGRTVTQDIDIDPRLMTDYSALQLKLIAHYSMDHCEDPGNTGLWADVSSSSEIVLDEAPIALPNELALLPAPFFDEHDVNPLRLTFVLPLNASDATLRTAAVIASSFGSLADYRQARFSVAPDLPKDQNAVLVAPLDELPPAVRPVGVSGPALVISDNPVAPGRKLLIVTGANAQDVDSAAYALVLRQPGLSGPMANVGRRDPEPERKPYDAPRLTPVDRPVRFAEVVKRPEQLQSLGGTPETISLELHVPVDLTSWNDVGAPLDVHYRYTSPSVKNNSALSIEMNRQLIKSYRLTPNGEAGGANSPGARSSTAELEVPAYQLVGSNQLDFRFNLDSERSTVCAGAAGNPARASIEPDSTIDFSRFVHYASMPNLAYFANSGFPFTRMADLSQTVVVVPARPAPYELETMLTMLGRIGRWTGYPALRVEVARPSESARLADKDVLLIGGSPAAPLVRTWSGSIPLAVDARSADVKRVGFAKADAPQAGSGALRLNSDAALAAVYGFQSPVASGRSVVALVASDATRARQLLDAFDDPERVGLIRDDVALVQGDVVESARIGERYAVGQIPWRDRVLGLASRHPVLLGVLGVFAGLLLAVGAFNFLQRLAQRRQGF